MSCTSNRRCLHVITREDAVADTLLREQKSLPALQVIVVDLREKHPDYDLLLEEIFKADSIHVR